MNLMTTEVPPVHDMSVCVCVCVFMGGGGGGDTHQTYFIT